MPLLKNLLKEQQNAKHKNIYNHAIPTPKKKQTD